MNKAGSLHLQILRSACYYMHTVYYYRNIHCCLALASESQVKLKISEIKVKYIEQAIFWLEASILLLINDSLKTFNYCVFVQTRTNFRFKLIE